MELDDETLCLAHHGCLVLVFWVRSPTPDNIERISALQRRVVDTHGYLVSLSSVPGDLEVSPDEATKRATANNLREFSESNLGIAVLVRQGGIRATLIRTVMTGIQLLALSPVKQRVFSELEPSLAWLRDRPGLSPAHADSILPLREDVDALWRHAYRRSG